MAINTTPVDEFGEPYSPQSPPAISDVGAALVTLPNPNAISYARINADNSATAVKIQSARVYNSAAISIPSAAETALTFDSERWDTNNLHSTSSNQSRLTCSVPGKYALVCGVRFSSNSTGYRYVLLRVNGIPAIAIHASNAVNGFETAINVATHYDLAANDYVEVFVFQNSGGALNVTPTPQQSPEFGMSLIG